MHTQIAYPSIACLRFMTWHLPDVHWVALLAGHRATQRGSQAPRWRTDPWWGRCQSSSPSARRRARRDGRPPPTHRPPVPGGGGGVHRWACTGHVRRARGKSHGHAGLAASHLLAQRNLNRAGVRRAHQGALSPITRSHLCCWPVARAVRGQVGQG